MLTNHPAGVGPVAEFRMDFHIGPVQVKIVLKI